MENQDQKYHSLHTYDGSSQNNKDELKKLKMFSQSRIMIYGFVAAIFLFFAGRGYYVISKLEKANPNGVSGAAMNEAFGNNTMFGIYSAIGKWGFVGLCFAFIFIEYFMMIRPHLKNIKEYNQLLKN